MSRCKGEEYSRTEGVRLQRGAKCPGSRGQIQRRGVCSRWEIRDTAWCMVLDLGWGQLVSKYMTLLYESLFPGHLQAGQSGVSKML